jgi:hypothetical protein
VDFGRRDFISLAGIASLAGCAGGGAMPLVTAIGSGANASATSSLAFIKTSKSLLASVTGHVFESIPNADGTVTITHNGSNLLDLKFSGETGAIAATASAFSTTLAMPRTPSANKWYTTSDRTLYHRFNSARQRYESTDTKSFVTTMGRVPGSGFVAGTGIRNATTRSTATGAVVLADAGFNAIYSAASELAASFLGKTALNPDVANRFQSYGTFLSAAKTYPTGPRPDGEVNWTSCWSTEVLNASGAVLSGTTFCNSFSYTTSGANQNLTFSSTTGQTNNPWVNCFIAVIGAYFSAQTLAAIINAIIGIFAAEGAAALAISSVLISILSAALLTVIGAAALALLITAMTAVFNECGPA